MLDAYCQGIESWWSVNATDESKKLSKIAVETITKWWHEYIFDNTDAAAKAIMQAANIAGQAICITQTTAPHAFSYKITSLYRLPHGHAVAVCLPEIWDYMLTQPISPELRNTFEEIANAMGVSSNPIDAVSKFRSMLGDMEIANPSSENRASDINILTKSVNPIRLRNSPVVLDENTIRLLYEKIGGI